MKNKVDPLFYVSNRLNLTEEDLIANPHGMLNTKKEDQIEELKNELIGLKEVFVNKIQPKIVHEKLVNQLQRLPKRETKKLITHIKKAERLTKKELSLLEILSDYFKHNLEDLLVSVPTKNVIRLKGRLQKKIGKHNLTIDSDKARGFRKDSYYRLVYSPITLLV